MRASELKRNSICSIKMDNSEPFESALALGRKLVEQLGLHDSYGTALGRWMAHHLADLMIQAENASRFRQGDCPAEILRRHPGRMEASHGNADGKRPYEELEPVIRTVESLDPKDTTPRYYRTPRPPKGQAAETLEQEKWLKMVDGLTTRPRSLSGTASLRQPKADWRNPKTGSSFREKIENDGVPEIVVRLISTAAEANQAPDLNAPIRRLLADRIKRLQAIVQLLNVFLKPFHRLQTLPPAKTAMQKRSFYRPHHPWVIRLTKSFCSSLR